MTWRLRSHMKTMRRLGCSMWKQQKRMTAPSRSLLTKHQHPVQETVATIAAQACPLQPAAQDLALLPSKKFASSRRAPSPQSCLPESCSGDCPADQVRHQVPLDGDPGPPGSSQDVPCQGARAHQPLCDSRQESHRNSKGHGCCSEAAGRKECSSLHWARRRPHRLAKRGSQGQTCLAWVRCIHTN